MYKSTKKITLGSCAFRQPFADSHCRFLHGYNLTAKFWFKCNELDINGWVVDFGYFKDIKEDLKAYFDHTLIIRKDDPCLKIFQDLHKAGGCDLTLANEVGIEAFAKLCFVVVNEYLYEDKDMVKREVRCVKVEVFEHDLNSAIFYNTKE